MGFSVTAVAGGWPGRKEPWRAAVARKLLTRAWHLLTDAEHAAAPQPAAPQTAAR